MSTSKFVQPTIPKFDDHYDFWTMENFLRSKELWSLVEEGVPTLVIGTRLGGETKKKIVEEVKLKDFRVNFFVSNY